jgi:hypothetical protein
MLIQNLWLYVFGYTLEFNGLRIKIIVILYGLKKFSLFLFSVVGLDLDELGLGILSSTEDLIIFEPQSYPWWKGCYTQHSQGLFCKKDLHNTINCSCSHSDL